MTISVSREHQHRSWRGRNSIYDGGVETRTEVSKISPKMKVVGGNEFPYLDIKMSYDSKN